MRAALFAWLIVPVLILTDLRAGQGQAIAQPAQRQSATPQQFGARADGVHDDTDAIQAAIDSLGNKAGEVSLPPGTYKVSRQITVKTDRVHIRGSGKYASVLLFAPTESGTCLKFGRSEGVLYQASLRGLTIFSEDSRWTKVGLELSDVSTMVVDDVSISGIARGAVSRVWSGGPGSTGVLLRGRETTSISNLNVSADRPIVIGPNPHDTISLDHFSLSNLYLLANGHPVVEIETGVNLSSVTFSGYQAWVGGTFGLYWNDTTSKQSSLALRLQNIRTEQGQSAQAHQIYISHNTALHGLSIENLYGGGDRNGVFLRKIVSGRISDWTYISVDKVALDSAATPGASLQLDNVFTQGNAKVRLEKYKMFNSLYPGSFPLPRSSFLQYDPR